MRVPVYATVHSAQDKVINCDFKPRSVERSVDLDKEGYTSATANIYNTASNENQEYL
jgi:hypothetical protein